MAFTFDQQGNIVPVTGAVPNTTIEKEFTLSQAMGNVPAGTKIMLAVSPVDTSESVELETYLGGYSNNGFIADLVSPIVPVDKETFKRRDFSHLNTFAPAEDRVGRSGAINQLEHASAVVENKTEEHALAAFIPYAAENDAVRGYSVRASHARMIREKLDLNREIRIMDAASATASWNAGNYTTITTNYRWSTGSTKDPLTDIRNRLKASWQHVSAIVMNLEVSGWFLRDANVKAFADFVLGTGGMKNGLIVESSMPGIQTFQLPGLPRFHVVDAKKYVSSAMSSILADDVLLLNTPSQIVGGDTLGSFLTFRYRGRSGTGYTVNEYVPVGRGLNGGTMLEAGYADADVNVGKSADGSTTSRIGGLIKSVLTGT